MRRPSPPRITLRLARVWSLICLVGASVGCGTEGDAPADAAVDAAGAVHADAVDGDAATHGGDGGAIDAGPRPLDARTSDATTLDASGSTDAAELSDATSHTDVAVADGGGDAASDDLGDAAAVQDAGEAGDAGLGDAGPSDAGPQTCFYNAPPGPDASVADVPQPDFSGCTLGPPGFFKAGEAVAKPSLKVELGTHDPSTGAFVPYIDDQWLPMVHGPQGGFHVYLATRVTLPGVSSASVKLQGEALGYAGCSLAAKGKQPVMYANADKSAPYAFTTATKTSAGTLVIFPAPSGLSHLYCGIWLELVVRVRQLGAAAWGESNVTVRLYDNK